MLVLHSSHKCTLPTLEKENDASPGFDSRTFQPLASCYTDYAMPARLTNLRSQNWSTVLCKVFRRLDAYALYRKKNEMFCVPRNQRLLLHKSCNRVMIILVITFIQFIYNYVPEINCVSRVYSAAAVLHVQFVLHVMLFRP
jgi:hypothetical protein